MKLKGMGWLLLSIAVSAIIMVEGVLVLALMQNVAIEGTGAMPSGDMVLFGALMLAAGAASLALGVLALLKPLSFEEGARLFVVSKLAKMLGGAAIALEGTMLALMAGRATVEGLGTYETYVVAAFVAQVFFLGLALLWLELISGLEFKAGRLLMYLGGLVAASQGVVLIGVADPTFIEGLGGIMERTVLIAGALLLAAGLVFLVSSYLVDIGLRFRAVFSTLRLVSGSLIVIAGLAITAMATNVTPEDIGTLTTRTIMLAGVQLALFGGVALLMSGSWSTSASHRWGKLSSMAAVFLLLLVPVAFFTVGRFW